MGGAVGSEAAHWGRAAFGRSAGSLGARGEAMSSPGRGRQAGDQAVAQSGRTSCASNALGSAHRDQLCSDLIHQRPRRTFERLNSDWQLASKPDE